ncbi:MAG: tetratricopeptide repeat protein [Alphaproteobacteria bacterium]|nr:tetratricopeptide repeat protein [Alphaproteobacteria bacterium]
MAFSLIRDGAGAPRRFFLPVIIVLATVVAALLLAVFWPQDTPTVQPAAPILADGKVPVPKAPAGALYKTTSFSGNYLAGAVARSENDSAAGSHFMKLALAADPGNVNVQSAVFLLKLQNGDVGESLSMARPLQERQPHNQISQMSLISDAFRRRDFAGAKLLSSAIDAEGLGELLRPLLIAWAEAGQGNTDAALAGLDPLLIRNSFRPFYQFHRALIASMAKRDALAVQYFSELLADSGSRSVRAAQAFGLYLETRDQYARAAEIYRSTLDPVQPHPILVAALADNSARRPAHLLISDAAAGAAEVLYGLSSVLSQDNELSPLPLIYLRLAVFMQPDFEQARLLLAGILEGLKRHDEAITIYSGIADTSPQYEMARIQVAHNQDLSDRSSDAIEGLRAYAAKYPDHPEMALLALADLLRSHERYQEAIPVYDKVIAGLGEPKQRHWPMLYARGITYERAGNWAEAERDLLRALELEPEQPNVLNYLAYSWIDKGLNIQRAKEMIESAVRQRPEDGAIIDSLGWIQYRTGEFAHAVETLENAISLMPQDAVINDHLGDAYWRVGRKLEAQFQWQRALSFNPAPEVKSGIEQKLQYGLDDSPAMPAPVNPSAQKS